MARPQYSVRRFGFPVAYATLPCCLLPLLLSACAGFFGAKPMASLQAGAGLYPSPEKRQTDRAKSLHKATFYWGNAFKKNPRDPKAALSYALNLKAMGEQQKAFQVLEQAFKFNPGHQRIASEYGRMALKAGNLQLAGRILEAANNSAEADWKVSSALGTVYAKTGNYKQAEQHLNRAHILAPNNPSISNNLALTLALSGQAGAGERLLRQVINRGQDTKRIRQNLALMLGLQGNFDEAKNIAETSLPPQLAQKNIQFLRDMIELPSSEKGPHGQPLVAPTSPPLSPSSTQNAQNIKSVPTVTERVGGPSTSQGNSMPSLLNPPKSAPGSSLMNSPRLAETIGRQHPKPQAAVPQVANSKPSKIVTPQTVSPQQAAPPTQTVSPPVASSPATPHTADIAPNSRISKYLRTAPHPNIKTNPSLARPQAPVSNKQAEGLLSKVVAQPEKTPSPSSASSSSRPPSMVSARSHDPNYPPLDFKLSVK